MENNYQVPEQNLSLLQARVTKLARRCKRIGIQVPVMTIGAPQEIRFKDAEGFDLIRRIYLVTIVSVERPKIEGFEFIAVLSPVTNDDGVTVGNVLRNVPGASITPEVKFRDADNYCDHCKTERRRLETFVITDGINQRQIGRNCLANFLGLTNPHQLAELAQILIDLDDIADMAEEDTGFGGGARTAERFPLDSVLEIASSAIRNYGWLSGKSAREYNKISTSGRVQEWINSNADARAKWEFPLTVLESDKQLAADTEEWLGTITDTTDDYMYNLSLLSQASSVVVKNFGIVVSAINAFSRAKEREIRRNARIESDKHSQYIGTPGERLTFENLLVVFTTKFATDFGVTHLYKMKAGENVVIYFSSRDLGFDQGIIIPKFTATVKKHELREEIRQTIVTRGVKPPRELSKFEKKAVNKLKRILKTIEGNQENYSAHTCLLTLIEEIKTNGFVPEIQSTQEKIS